MQLYSRYTDDNCTRIAARFSVSFSQLYVALYPLVKLGLIFSVNHYVTHETFVCGNSQLLTILEVKNILTNHNSVLERLGVDLYKTGIIK